MSVSNVIGEKNDLSGLADLTTNGRAGECKVGIVPICASSDAYRQSMALRLLENMSPDPTSVVAVIRRLIFFCHDRGFSVQE